MKGYFSLPLLRYNLKSRTKSFIVWSVASLCIFILIVVMFMNLLSSGLPDIVSNMLQSVPTSVSGEGGAAATPDFTDFGINFGACMQVMLIVGCVYACYLGASANSNGHGGDSDITFIYSMPISRMGAVITSFASQFITLAGYNIIVLLVSAAVMYSNNKADYLPEVLLAIGAFLLIQTVYMSLGFLFSTFMSSSTQASSVTAVTVAVTVLFGLVGSLATTLKPLTFLSPYKYISVYSIISGQEQMFFIGIVASILITIAALSVSCVRYDKKDFLLD